MSTANFFPIGNYSYPGGGFIARAEPIIYSQYWNLFNEKPTRTYDEWTVVQSHCGHPLLCPRGGCVASSSQSSSQCWSFGNKKPKITFNGRSADENLHALKTMITAGVWSDNSVTNYLISVIMQEKDVFEGTLTEEWLCKPDVKIGDKNSKITPLDLLNVIIDATHEKYQPPANSSVSSTAIHKSRFASLLYIYRAATAREQNTGTAMQRRLQMILTSSLWRVQKEHFTDLDGFVSEFSLTVDYRKIVAAVDMFFHFFPLHNSSNIRYCTLLSRYKGCRALTLLTEISTSLGLEPHELVCFVLNRFLAKEVFAIGTPGQHAEDVKGYFPYQLDLGIVSKSAYSAKANPSLWLWLHTIGTMLNFSSSAKAVKIGGNFGDEGIVISAVHLVQCLQEGSDLLPGLPPNATLDEKVKHIIVHHNANRLTEAQIEDARRKFEPYSNLRNNTIGYFLAQKFLKRDFFFLLNRDLGMSEKSRGTRKFFLAV